jgi:hypothetical protein
LGTLSIVLGIISICIGWLPGVGWSGVLLGFLGAALGVVTITHWHAKAGYTGWGICGIVLGVTSTSLSLAYQIKHAAGALDTLYVSLSTPAAGAAIGATAAIIVLGVVLARKRRGGPGLLLAWAAIAVLSLSGAWALTAADRATTSSAPPDSR